MIKEIYKTNMFSKRINLNPLELYMLDNFIYREDGHFNIHYREWIARRINKILSVYNIEFFKGKRILILGDGIGIVGSFFASLDSDVLALENRKFNINFIKLRTKNIKNYEVKEFNLNKDFTKFGKFDIIINWGLIEEVSNVNNVLKCCAEMSDLIFLETCVADNSQESFISSKSVLKKVNASDVGIEGEDYVRVSEKYIEEFFKKKGFSFTKYLDSDLNSTINIYDWKNKNDNSISYKHKRRFWIIENLK